MQTTWVLAADSSRVRIFQELDAKHHLKEVQDFANPAGRAQASELLTGKPERRILPKGALSSSHDGEARTLPIAHENALFSKEVCNYLEHARSQQRFDHLHVIAAPKFLGLLRKNLHQETQKLVTQETNKDISWWNKTEIEHFLQSMLH